MSDRNSRSHASTQHREKEDLIAPVFPPPTPPRPCTGSIPQPPDLIQMDPSAHETVCSSFPVPGTSDYSSRIEVTLRGPPMDQEEFPVAVSGAYLPSATMPTPIKSSFPLATTGIATTMTRPITPTFPSCMMFTPPNPTVHVQPRDISDASMLPENSFFPVRHGSPSLPLDRQLPPRRQGAPMNLFSVPLPLLEEPAACTDGTPFECYLRNSHIHERSMTDPPSYSLGGRGRVAEEFDRSEYRDVQPDFPESVQFPKDTELARESQVQSKAPIPPGTTPGHIEMVTAFQKRIQDKCHKEDHTTTASLRRQELAMLGIRMQELRCELHNWFKDWIINHGSVPVVTQKDFAFLLIESDVYEDKLAAVLFIQEVLIFRKHISIADMPRFESIFRGGHIKVYKICDHFADKVLCYLASQTGQESQQVMINALFEWTRADDVWQARAGLSALSNQAGNVHLHDRLLQAVEHMMARPEEEAKSMAGTVLRSISDVDAAKVIDFLSRPGIIAGTSVHALAKATSRLAHAQKIYFKTLRQEVKATKT